MNVSVGLSLNTTLSSPSIFDPAAWMASARGFFASGCTRAIDFRREQLHKLDAMIAAREAVWLAALAVDLGKPESESRLAEIGWVRNDIRHALRHLDAWSRPRRRRSPLGLRPGRSRVLVEPKGVVLVLGPWNYPLQLLFSPLVSAMAAGNVACVKPSELAPTVSRAVAQAIGETFAPDYLAVCEGGVEAATRLLEQRFDHIFFTGGTAAGRSVMAAAARGPTPVTLELGGKSPCLVCADSDVRTAARRIAWGKFMNAGQTCVAPDYVLVDRAVRDPLIVALSESVTNFFGTDPSCSPDYGRIVNLRHFDRLLSLLDAGQRVCGGAYDAASRYLAPTILSDPCPESPVMQEEIFGPILPVLSVSGLHEMLVFVNARPVPLALYLFTDDRRVRRQVIGGTRSGGVCVNDTIMQLFNRALPFGGLGDSGIGVSHGRDGFETFSHFRALVERRLRPDFAARYPPSTVSAATLERINRWLFGS